MAATQETLPLELPEGAATIIRSLAAEEIFLQLASQCYRLPDNCAKKSFVRLESDNGNKTDTRRLMREMTGLVQQFPSICHRRYNFNLAANEHRCLFALAIVCCLPHTDHPSDGLALVKAVFESNPDALKQNEPIKGSRPLHYACSFQAPLDVVKFLWEQDQESARVTRLDGMLPLHLCLYFRAPVSVTEFFLQTWPQAVFERDKGSWTALHAAASGQADLALVKRICDMYPDSLLQVDNKGRTPLHMSCWQKGNDEVVEFLWHQAPHTLHMEDNTNETCLFRACRSQCLSVLQIFLAGDNDNDDNNNDPPPLDDLGATLLHFAALDNALDVVEFLVDRYPAMVTRQTTDRDQYLPLHTACHFDAPLENIKILVQRQPETLQTKTGHGETAEDLAVKHKSSKETIQYLQSQSLARKKQKLEARPQKEQANDVQVDSDEDVD